MKQAVTASQTGIFDKTATNLCKGVAICIMVYYHTFGATDGSWFRPILPVLYNILGPFGNVCVPFFVILTGYGFALQALSNNRSIPSQIARRTIQLYRGYWPVFLVGLIAAPFLACEFGTWAFAFGDGPWYSVLEHFCLNALGLSHYAFGDGIYTLNQTWWYISLALVLILFLPLLSYLWRRMGWLAMVPVTILALFMPGLRYLAYFPGAMLGVCLAGSNGFAKLHNCVKGIPGVILRFLALFVILVIWYRLRQHDLYPVLANTLAAWGICQFSFDILGAIPGVSHCLSFLGKHSANIFYLHSFLCTYWTVCQWFVFGFRYDLLIWLVILLLSLAMSIVLELMKKYSRWNALFDRLLRLTED